MVTSSIPRTGSLFEMPPPEKVKHCHRLPKRKARLVAAPTETAAQAIGTLAPGCRIFGLTKGQFSLLDLIRAVLAQTGPAEVALSTWTTGVRDVENVRLLCERGEIAALTLLVDFSFPKLKPEYCREVIKAFGPKAIRCTRTHAKFAVIRNAQWSVAVRSSMNLNRNPRFEQFDLDEDPALCDFLMAYVAEIGELMPPGTWVTDDAVNTGFRESLGGGLSEAYLPEGSEPDALDALLRCLNANPG